VFWSGVAVCFIAALLSLLVSDAYFEMSLGVISLLSGGTAAGIFVGWKFHRRLSLLEVEDLNTNILNKDYQEEWQNLSERLRLVEQSANDGIWDWDIVRNSVYWSDRIYEFLGLDRAQKISGFSDIRKYIHEDDVGKFEKAIREHLRNDKPFHLEVRILNEKGEYANCLLRGKVHRDSQGRPVRMAGSLKDVSKRREMEQKLLYNSLHDSLTGLINRRFFIEKLKQVIRLNKTRKDPLFAVLVMDLDKFKQVNDAFGSEAGDALLKHISEILDSHRRASDVLARVGGDEFALMLVDIRHAGDANNVAMRIKHELEEPVRIGNSEITISASMGIAFNAMTAKKTAKANDDNNDDNNDGNNDGNSGEDEETHENTPDDEMILANAYTVLRKAKRAGHGKCEVFTEGLEEGSYKLYKRERELRQAIVNKELSLHYQPIVNQVDGSVSGFEALVRWNKSEHDMIPPAEFIPLAEESGLIIEMGHWILTEACTQASKWVQQGYEDITVAVNFSARQFLQQNVAAIIKKVLRQTGLDSKNLKVEITETTAMNSVEQTMISLRSLSEMGVKISIDDFGTGYSSLSYLKKYPIDTLKIDRSFISEIPGNSEDAAITKTIIALAKNLNLQLIAEGVETPAQLEFLQKEQCDQIQGFLFSKPLDAEKATRLLEKGNYEMGSFSKSYA